MNCVTKLVHFDKSGSEKIQGVGHVLQFLNFQRILYSIVRPPCSDFMRLAAPLVMIIGKAELDPEYNRLLITKGLEHCFLSL